MDVGDYGWIEARAQLSRPCPGPHRCACQTFWNGRLKSITYCEAQIAPGLCMLNLTMSRASSMPSSKICDVPISTICCACSDVPWRASSSLCPCQDVRQLYDCVCNPLQARVQLDLLCHGSEDRATANGVYLYYCTHRIIDGLVITTHFAGELSAAGTMGKHTSGASKVKQSEILIPQCE